MASRPSVRVAHPRREFVVKDPPKWGWAMNTSSPNTVALPTPGVATPEPAGGVAFGKPNTKKARSRVEKMLAQIAAAHKAGSYKKAKHLSIIYLRSFDARYIAVLVGCGTDN